MPAPLDALVAQIVHFLGPRHGGAGRPPKLTDAELITLAVAQVCSAWPMTASSSRWRGGGWATCFPS